MLPRVDYLSWAIEAFPRAKWNLATSGVLSISSAELGTPASLSDPHAMGAFASKIAARYGVPVEEVVPALGTSGAVWTAAAAVLPVRGDSQGEPAEVVVEAPTYEPLLRVMEGLGARVRRVDRPAIEGYRLDPARVAGALTDRTRLVVMASPHNPSGMPSSDEDIAAIAEACAARGAYLLVDEVYRELVAPRTTARTLRDNVIAVSSLTKCFGVGWARAGWAILPVRLREAARAAEIHVSGQLPTTCGAIGAHALDRLDDLAARAGAIAAGKRAIVDAFVARHPQLSWTPPPASALFGLLRVEGADVEAGLARAEREHGLLAVPGSFFGVEGALRISWATVPVDRLDEALGLLAGALGLAT